MQRQEEELLITPRLLHGDLRLQSSKGVRILPQMWQKGGFGRRAGFSIMDLKVMDFAGG